VTKTLPAEAPGQHSVRKFFRKKGFMQIGEDPGYFYYHGEAGFVYRLSQREKLNIFLKRKIK